MFLHQESLRIIYPSIALKAGKERQLSCVISHSAIKMTYSTGPSFLTLAIHPISPTGPIKFHEACHCPPVLPEFGGATKSSDDAFSPSSHNLGGNWSRFYHASGGIDSRSVHAQERASAILLFAPGMCCTENAMFFFQTY